MMAIGNGLDSQSLRVRSVGARYARVARLGSGGFGDVFLAVARGVAGFRKLVVVKQLKSTDAASVALFLDEARLAARIHHPNVVQTNDIAIDDGGYFLVMEYLDGQPLSRVLRRCARERQVFPMEMHLAIVVDVLRGLHASHELRDADGRLVGVVHRDVSPQNVFVTYDGQVKIVDFGIAKARDRSAETATGIIKGKITYMSPEQSIASADVDRRSDVFAAGILLYEAITGRRYWTVGAPREICRRLLAGDAPRWPRAIVPDVDPELDAICARALAPHPEQRYATAAEMADALDDYLLGVISGRPLAAQIARYVSDLFALDRARMRSLIDERLTLLEVRLALLDAHPQGEPATAVLPPASSPPPPALIASTRRRATSRAGRAVLVAIAAVAALGVAATLVTQGHAAGAAERAARRAFSTRLQ